jgi:hypothetical protein
VVLMTTRGADGSSFLSCPDPPTALP